MLIVKRRTNPENWSLAKTVMLSAAAEGIDLSDEEELWAYIQQHGLVGMDDEQSEPEFDSSDEKPPVKIVEYAEGVGRNEPRPCGSGRKYKKCCGKTERQHLEQ